MQQITKNFTIKELTNTSYKELLADNIYYALDNWGNFRLLAFFAQEVRDLLGVPMIITSAVRCPALNAKVGSSNKSQHLTLQAIDFVPSKMTLQQAFDKIRKSDLQFGQLIIEKSNGKEWIHISIGKKREVKKYDGKRYVII